MCICCYKLLNLTSFSYSLDHWISCSFKSFSVSQCTIGISCSFRSSSVAHCTIVLAAISQALQLLTAPLVLVALSEALQLLIAPLAVAALSEAPQLVSIAFSSSFRSSSVTRGWSGGAKVLCILHHWGVQLILAYSWARPAILVVGKGRGGMFLFLLFLHFHSCSSFFPVPLFHLLYSLFYLFSPFLWETTQNDPQGLTCR